MENITPIMINKGDKITCIETLKASGMVYFVAGEEYDSPDNNCLNSLRGEVFVQQQYLKHFAFKIVNPHHKQ